MRRPKTPRAAGTLGRWRLLAGLALLPLAMALAPADLRSAADGDVSVDDTRTALEQWVQNRRLIAGAERDWKLGKQVLQDRIELIQGEIEALRGRIAEAEADVGEADSLLAGLADEVATLEQASTSVSGVVADYEGRTASLLARFPEPLQDGVRMLSQRLPSGDEARLPSLSQRFLTIIGILDEANRFHREVSATSEVRSLADGTQAEVTALYVGLGAAFYANAAGTAAGVGRASPEGWRWTAADAAAAAIAEAIKVQQGEQMARFVQLPVELDDDAPAGAAGQPEQDR